MSFQHRARPILRALAVDALRTLRWSYLEAIYAQTPLGVIEGVMLEKPTRAVLSLTYRSWATELLAASLGQEVDVWRGGLELTALCPLTVVRVDPVQWQLHVDGNASDLQAIAHEMRQPRGANDYLTLHFPEAHR